MIWFNTVIVVLTLSIASLVSANPTQLSDKDELQLVKRQGLVGSITSLLSGLKCLLKLVTYTDVLKCIPDITKVNLNDLLPKLAGAIKGIAAQLKPLLNTLSSTALLTGNLPNSVATQLTGLLNPILEILNLPKFTNLNKCDDKKEIIKDGPDCLKTLIIPINSVLCDVTKQLNDALKPVQDLLQSVLKVVGQLLASILKDPLNLLSITDSALKSALKTLNSNLSNLVKSGLGLRLC